MNAPKQIKFRGAVYKLAGGRVCSLCDGEGRTHLGKCSQCKGTGFLSGGVPQLVWKKAVNKKGTISRLLEAKLVGLKGGSIFIRKSWKTSGKYELGGPDYFIYGPFNYLNKESSSIDRMKKIAQEMYEETYRKFRKENTPEKRVERSKQKAWNRLRNQVGEDFGEDLGPYRR